MQGRDNLSAIKRNTSENHGTITGPKKQPDETKTKLRVNSGLAHGDFLGRAGGRMRLSEKGISNLVKAPDWDIINEIREASLVSSPRVHRSVPSKGVTARIQ